MVFVNTQKRSGRRRGVQTARSSILGGQIRTKVWLEHDGRFVMGDGGLRLLEAIERLGSLAAAVRAMGWSYRHAWGYLRRAEAVLGLPLLRARAGRGAARGVALTEDGHHLLARLAAARASVDAAVGPAGPSPDEIAARGRRR
jgi:molybdate transport system regulatory protein